MKTVFFLATVSAALALPQDAARSENSEYWASYLQTVSSLQTAPPTKGPTPSPTPGPTPLPTLPPTPAPTLPPTPAPTISPSAPPTGTCQLTVDLTCVFNNTETGVAMPCDELPPMDNLFCTCPDCVRELMFTYTASPCNGTSTDNCIDFGFGPDLSAVINFAPCGSLTAAFSQPVTIGAPIVLALPDDACLPACMDVTVADAISGDLQQAFTIDTTCGADRGLALKDLYGSIEFIGYSCDDTDVNNCYQEIEYAATVCNEGIQDETIYDFIFSAEVGIIDFLGGENPVLPPGECLALSAELVADKCVASEYCANVVVNGTNPDTDKPFPCEDMAEYCFITESQTPPPTAGPTPAPTPATPAPTVATPGPTVATPAPTVATPAPTIETVVTPVPTPSPTPFPTVSSPPPSTTDCQIEVIVTPTCPVVGCEWNRCLERPFRMEFRVTPAPCEASALNRCQLETDNTCACDRNRTLEAEEWPDQKFFCTDDPDFAGVTVPDYRDPANRPESETFWIIATPEKDPSVFYFNGPIEFGNSAPLGANVFNATDPGLERVEANGFLRLYTADPAVGGVQLQEVLFHSSCSQELWLFDIFGSFQLIEFEGLNTGVTGSFDTVNLEFTINLDANAVGGALNLDFFSITLLTATPGLLLPQTQEFNVDGVSLPPSFVTDWDVSITPELEYIAITTIGGNFAGNACFDVSQQPIFCPRVITPGETPGPNPGDHTPNPSVAP